MLNAAKQFNQMNRFTYTININTLNTHTSGESSFNSNFAQIYDFRWISKRKQFVY